MSLPEDCPSVDSSSSRWMKLCIYSMIYSFLIIIVTKIKVTNLEPKQKQKVISFFFNYINLILIYVNYHDNKQGKKLRFGSRSEQTYKNGTKMLKSNIEGQEDEQKEQKEEMSGVKRNSSSSGNDDSSYEVEYIIDEKKKNGKDYYLVKWVGYSEEEATWEPQSHLVNCPEILLRFKMSKFNKEDINEMINEDFVDDSKAERPLPLLQYNIRQVISREEENKAWSRYLGELVEQSKELNEGMKIQTILNIFPRKSETEGLYYWVKVENYEIPKKMSKEDIKGLEGGSLKLIEFYDERTLFK